VVADARAALENGDVTRVLKWVRPEREEEIRAAFRKTVAVRGMGEQARDLADAYFFEALVRVHRAGEGAAYTGLKPAGSAREPAVVAADRALKTGSVDELARLVTDAADSGIRARFAEVIRKREHSSDSVAAGREYVEAYVEFIHHVERLHEDAGGGAGRHVEHKGGDEHRH